MGAFNLQINAQYGETPLSCEGFYGTLVYATTANDASQFVIQFLATNEGGDPGPTIFQLATTGELVSGYPSSTLYASQPKAGAANDNDFFFTTADGIPPTKSNYADSYLSGEFRSTNMQLEYLAGGDDVFFFCPTDPATGLTNVLVLAISKPTGCIFPVVTVVYIWEG